MSYGHAQRNLDALIQLTAETVTLLRQLDPLTEDQACRLRDVGPGLAHRETDRTEVATLGR